MDGIIQFKKPQSADPPAKAASPVYTDFSGFYEAYYSRVVGYLYKHLKRREDAEDIAGKTFLYCYEKWDTYDPAKASQVTWLFMIVRSRWTDFLRSSKTHADIDALGDTLPTENDPLDNAIRLQALRQEMAEALKTLPESQRTALVLRYFGNCTDEQIAQKLGITTTNVRVRVHRAIEKLRENPLLRDLL